MTYDEMRMMGANCLVRLAPETRRAEGISSTLHVVEALPPPVCMGRIALAGPRCTSVKVGDVVVFGSEVGEVVDGFPSPHLIVAERQLEAVAEKA